MSHAIIDFVKVNLISWDNKTSRWLPVVRSVFTKTGDTIGDLQFTLL